MHITFNKIDGFIISLDGKIKHLVLFDYGLFDKICDKIEYLISKKVVLQIVLIIILERLELIYIIFYQLKKILTFHNVIILIKSDVNEKIKIYTTIIYF